MEGIAPFTTMDIFPHIDVSDWVVCTIGIFVYIAWIFKTEGDKYEKSKTDFPVGKYVRKNFFDLLFVVISGYAFLIISEEIFKAIDKETLPGFLNYDLLDISKSMFSGALGSFLLTMILKRFKRMK